MVLTAALVAGCDSGGRSDGQRATSSTGQPGAAVEIGAQVASYDLSVNRPQRVLVGLTAAEGSLVSFGSAEMSFAYLGSREKPTETAQVYARDTAEWMPIPGQRAPSDQTAPRVVAPSDGAGVYVARDVIFDRAGFWGVRVVVPLDGKLVEAQAQFDVLAKPEAVAPGDPAPPSENPLPGRSDVSPKAVDSRASKPGEVPDPELHRQTVAGAIASGRPTMVVISTPTYCVSRFCGPITDSVQALARRYEDRMNFIHIEVWRDFEATTMNKAAADWILPPGTNDVHEPWVYVIGNDGIVQERFDNVVSDAELESAVREATA